MYLEAQARLSEFSPVWGSLGNSVISREKKLVKKESGSYINFVR